MFSTWPRFLCRAGLAFVLLACTALVNAQVLGDDAPEFLNTVARVPLRLELGDENLIAPRLGFEVGAALYPLPLLLDRELNLAGFANLTYTLRGGVGGALANANAALYAGAGPRYRLVNSELLLNGNSPGTYLGVGSLAGAEFNLDVIGLSLVSAFVEAGGDYLWPAGGAIADGQLVPRVRVGLGIPVIAIGIPLVGGL